MKPARVSGRWMVLPLLLGLLVLLDRPPPPTALHRAEWLDAGGAPVRAVRAGSGPPTLLLLHGFGESLTTWRAVFDPLADRQRVVAIDLPGFGGSAKPDAPYTLPALTARLAAFVDRWIDGPVVVVGHSMGGALAAALALERPDRVERLVLIAPAGWRIGLGGIMDSMTPGRARALGWYLAARSFITPIHDPAWLAEPDSMARYDLTDDPAYPRAAARVLEEFDFTGLRHRFRDIRQPTLLIWGGLDPVIPFSIADSVAQELSCGRLAPLPDALHRPQAEVPDAVVAQIRAFVGQAACGTGP